MNSKLQAFVNRKEKALIKKALKTNRTSVLIKSQHPTHDGFAEYHISDVRISKGQLQGKSLAMGYWFAIKSWRIYTAGTEQASIQS